jgi:hypothetical protein
MDARHPLALAATMPLAQLPAFPGTQYPAHAATTPAITAADLWARDKAISDDAFEGRAPATQSGESGGKLARRRNEANRTAPGKSRQLFPAGAASDY